MEIPYQTLEQDDIESIRITENSGLSFIFTFTKNNFFTIVRTKFMLHETWKERTPIKKVEVINTDAKKFYSF